MYLFRSWRGVLDTTLCEKVCQWLAVAAGQWFLLGPPVSSTIKPDRHNITEILLKVVFNTKIWTLYLFQFPTCLSKKGFFLAWGFMHQLRTGNTIILWKAHNATEPNDWLLWTMAVCIQNLVSVWISYNVLWKESEVMVNNSTNINKTNNHLSPQPTECKEKGHGIWLWKYRSLLGTGIKCMFVSTGIFQITSYFKPQTKYDIDLL